mgnify:CR=1 FL=1
MEIILVFLLFIIASVVIRLIFSGASAGAKAAYNVVTGRDTFSDSFKTEFIGMGNFEIQVVQTVKVADGFEFGIFEIQARGIIPVPSSYTECSIYIQLFDNSSDSSYPVVSILDQYCENDSRVFQHIVNLGPVPSNSGYRNWVTISNVIIDSLSFPYSGIRNLTFQACVVPSANPPIFNLGQRSNESGHLFAVAKSTAQFNSQNIGYMEEIQFRKEVQEITIGLAFYIAFSDNRIASEEASTIKEWIVQIIENYSSDTKEYHKERLNNAIRSTYDEAIKGEIQLQSLVDRMNQIASPAEKYEAIELCLDVIKADNKLESSEIEQVNFLAAMLNIEPERFRALQDRRITDVDQIDITTESAAQILGITDDMTKEEIKTHLASEYRKWNSRVNSSDEKVREKAKEMLFVIGQVRNMHLNDFSQKENEYK